MSTYGLSVLGADLKSLAQTAQAADAAGFDAVWASEFYSRSGSISMAAMANSTQNCRIGSSILYGVGRSPLVLATEARDLDELSNGRLVLGIGNGTKRMMGDWHGVPDTSAPALRMEELVMLLRRIWNLHEGPIHHEGRFLQNESHPDRRRGTLQQADPDRHCRCPAPDVRGGRAGGRRPSRTSAVHNHLRRRGRPARYRQGRRAHRPRPQ